jgi:hypothetical protein
MHAPFTLVGTSASTPPLVDYDRLEPFLASVARHLHTVHPQRRDRALRLITRQFEIELGLVEVEVALGADIVPVASRVSSTPNTGN